MDDPNFADQDDASVQRFVSDQFTAGRVFGRQALEAYVSAGLGLLELVKRGRSQRAVLADLNIPRTTGQRLMRLAEGYLDQGYPVHVWEEGTVTAALATLPEAELKAEAGAASTFGTGSVEQDLADAFVAAEKAKIKATDTLLKCANDLVWVHGCTPYGVVKLVAEQLDLWSPSTEEETEAKAS